MKWFASFLLFACCLSQGFGVVVRTLTNTTGVKIEAEITGIWQGKVTFTRISDKKSFTVLVNSLVQADQDFLNQRIHFLTLPPPDSGFADGAVIVAGVKGVVKVVSDSSAGSESRPAVVGESFGPDALITTEKASSAILLFTNGTIATLTEESRILVKTFLQSKFESNSGLVNEMKEEPSSSILRLNLDFGNLVVDVKKLNKGSSMTMHSPVGVVGIRGTQFHLFYRGEASYLEVLNGSVDYAGGALPLRIVASGKRQEALRVAGRNDPALNPIKDIPAAQIAALKNYFKAARENDFVAKATLDDLRKAAFKGELIWEFKMASAGASAIGSDGTVYVSGAAGGLNPPVSRSQKVYALDGQTGKQKRKWDFSSGTRLGTPAIGSDGTVYVISGPDFSTSQVERVNALNGQTGTKKWDFPTGSRATSLAIGSDGTVYLGPIALDGQTGKKKWEFEGRGSASAPAIGSDGTVYFGLSDKKIYALDGQTGKKKWDFPTGSRATSPAIGSDGTVYLGVDDNKTYALDGQTGKKKWEFVAGDKVGSPAIGSDGTVYVGSDDNKTYALDGQTGKKKWEFVAGGKMGTPAIGSDGTVYVGAQHVKRRIRRWLLYSNKVYALDGKTGRKKWEFVAGETYRRLSFSPTIGSDGTIYFTSGYSIYAIATESKGPAKSPWPMRGQNAQRTGRAPKK